MEAIEKMQELLKKMTKYINDIESENKYLKKNIECLFNEDEIKNSPKFELLKKTYNITEEISEKTTTKPKMPETNIFDEFYSPPSVRKAQMKKIEISKKIAVASLNSTKNSSTSSASATSTTATPTLPLPPPLPPTTIATSIIPSAPTLPPTPIIPTYLEFTPKNKVVLKLEISGELYYVADNLIFNSQCEEAGQINDEGIVLKEKPPIAIDAQIKLSKIDGYNEFYQDDAHNAYKLINKCIAFKTGNFDITDNQINEFE